MITFAWRLVRNNVIEADCLWGRARIVGNTLPPVLKRWAMGGALGYTVYWKGKRIGWEPHEAAAVYLVETAATNYARERTKGRLA